MLTSCFSAPRCNCHNWQWRSLHRFITKCGLLFPCCLLFYGSGISHHACAPDSRYWCAPYAAVVLVEHLVFRRGDFARYHVEDWDQPRKLPPGIAAILSGALGMGIIVLCMDQVGILYLLFLIFSFNTPRGSYVGSRACSIQSTAHWPILDVWGVSCALT